MIACLAIILNYSYLQPLLYFVFFDSFCLASLFRSRLLFNSAILLSATLVRATPARLKCAVRRTVKVVRRHARECTMKKLYMHINIYIGFSLNTTYMLARFALSLKLRVDHAYFQNIFSSGI